ncbi:aldose 1-epimerase family protein [Flavobacterium muglaense]|uniref:Aldose 1-epimerase family protein n=1 Tax=Flavobacterium muglaense TaxID=2764716 RepID=A0A923MZE2_9FLAO|nr:aldose 1-epimerase family protein [Flavobacterium muglaense]MBC5838017.1 aldose 1-epimerase family protein [Flavobacterium muglaense]MBC5844551.1 aldose 1-epimerase family protein [Flavobacterium muglaense]
MTTTLFNSDLTAKINHLGAELFSLESNNKEYIWEGNPEFWGKHSPILFPIVGTLKNNTYSFKGKPYKLSRHGFARDNEFVLIEKQDHRAVFSLKSNTDTLKVYPFDFELQIIYTLAGNDLTIAYQVINSSTTPMPFSIGAHPAIALTGDFEKYSIQFEKNEPLQYHLLEDDLISNKTETLSTTDNKVALNYKIFENDALIFKTLESDYLTILENKKPLIRVHYKDFPHLGIWTKTNAPFLCIEPWFGYSDSTETTGNIMQKEGIQILQPKSTFNAEFSIQIL